MARRDRRPPRRHGGLFLALLTAALLSLVGLAGPATAVTPRPTDYRSSVQSIEPSAPITVRVIGGDTLLDLRAEPGHEVVVSGYGGEPYLRVRRDGTTQVNARSPAVSLNRTRDANLSGSSGDGGSVGDQPDWQTMGHDSRLVWHDHRIHTQDGAAFTGELAWSVPLTVDDVAVTIDGRLVRVDPPSPLPYLAVGAVVAVLTWLTGRHRARLVAAIALIVASTLATATGAIEWLSLPGSVARNVGVFLLPLVAGLAAGLGLALRRRTPTLVALLASVSLLSGWLAFRWSILTRSVLVSDLDPVIDRVALAVVLGAVAAAAGLTVQWAGTPIDPAAPVSRGRDRPSAPAPPAPSPHAAG